MNDEIIIKRIGQIALRVAPDYPDVGVCEPLEQLWAIEASYLGTAQANGAMHKLLDRIRSKFGMSVHEMIELMEAELAEREK